MSALLEVCTGDFASVCEAVKGGAKRIELCSALSEGGLTPSLGLLTAVRENFPELTVHVLIRPRRGDFLYDNKELDIMLRDIELIRQAGAQGVVVGALTAEGDIAEKQVAQMVKAAEGMNVTFHRAFDLCRDPEKGLKQIIGLGCQRLLTSGQATSAEEGISNLRQYVNETDGRLIILAGGGINAKNAPRIIRETGGSELHASAKSRRQSKMTFQRQSVSMGAPEDEYSQMITDSKQVSEILDAISSL